MIAAILAGLMAFAPASLTGTVQSADHLPVPSAVVSVQQNGRTLTATTDDKGAFTLADAALPATIEVRADGFTTVRLTVSASPVTVTLQPSPIRESIVVTEPAGTDWWRRGATGTTVLSSRELQQLPGLTMDESLRVLSGLSLFRRTSARASNPTTHGVTMRGLSASGSSRGLVLLDGIQLNDGFGGWVTWTRLPTLATSTVSIDRGPQGATFGSDALGGVIEMTTPGGDNTTAIISAGGGTVGVGSFDGSGGGRTGPVAWFGAVSWYTTDGVIPVAPESRGAVDTPADAQWTSGFLKASFGTNAHRLTFSALGSSDDRGNGTVLQRNTMEGGTVAAAYSGSFRSTNLAARLSGSPNRFTQSFSAVGAGRNTETLTSTQFIETWTTRGVVEAGRAIPRGYVTGRAMFNLATSDFTEMRPAGTTFMALTDNSEAVAMHAAWTPWAAVSIGAGIRHEWRKAPDVDDSHDQATVGHVSAAWQLSPMIALRGSAATSHRWPTLNELVRNFQVGAILTQANPDLLPERAVSGEGAIAFTGQRWMASVGGFATEVEDAIANVTIQTAPIIRQRRNAGRAVAHGAEVDAEYRLFMSTTIRASAMLVDSKFRDSLEPALEGKWLPQVPRSSVSVSADIHPYDWLQGAVVYRFLSEQFDDDRNVFQLAEAHQVDVRLFGTIHRNFSWQVTVDNAADARIEVGKTPLVTLAPGRSVRAGIMWKR